MQDTIEHQVTIARPIARVWEALTVAEELAQWFGDSAEIDLQPEGAMRVGWSDYGEVIECVVDEVEYPSRFSYSWRVGQTADGRVWTTKVTFTLEESAGKTTVTVVESGLADLPADLHARTMKENSSGWISELSDLEQFLDAGRAT